MRRAARLRSAPLGLGLLMLWACAAPSGLEKGSRWVAVDPEPQGGASQPGGAGRRFALVVGVDDFEDPRFTPLRYAGRDAEAVASALTGFQHVVRLTGEQTRRPTVLSALSDLLREANDPSDTVVVYVSSHGSLAQRPGGGLERVLVTHDARMDLLLQTGLPIDDLTQMLEHATARRRLLVLALCHSGKGKSQLPDALSTALARQKEVPSLASRSEATIVLTACAFGETARESDELQADVYTHFLLEGLAQGDLDGDGAITASEAHDYARERTYQFTQGQQRPTSESELLGVDPIVLRGARSRLGQPVVFSYARSAQGLKVRVDGREKGPLPGGIALEPGSHRLELVDAARDRALYAGEISLAPGERRDLATLLPPPPRLEGGAGLVAYAPLSAPFRSDEVAPGLGARARLAVPNLAARGLLAEATLDYWQARGSAPGIGTRLSTVVHSGDVDLGLGLRRELGPVRLDGLLTGGGWLLYRERSAPGFSGADGTLAPLAGARLRAGGAPGAWPVALALALDLRAAWPEVRGQRGPTALLGAGLEASWPRE